jgi:transcription initiation factor IIE alpha subunit
MNSSAPASGPVVDATPHLDEMFALLMAGKVDEYRRKIAYLYEEDPATFEAVVLQHKAELEEATKAADLDALPHMNPKEREAVFEKLTSPRGYKRRYSSIEGFLALRPKDYSGKR